jgi:O-6-methylguanine DNA methyltransferase
MTPKHPGCLEIEPSLVATAAGEAATVDARRVAEHVERCAACRDDLERYRAIEGIVGALRNEAPSAAAGRARVALETRLADLRSRLVAYRVFRSPLGLVLIAKSEQGVSLVKYLDRPADVEPSLRALGLEGQEDGAEVETLYRDLTDYLEGRRTRLTWPLDLRLARSRFHRAVLEATASIPYGAVTSYARIAHLIGKPAAVRAVAQALRTNPLPIVVPCHRVIGSSGALTGYAGRRVALKERLLAVEGVPTVKAHRELAVARDTMYVRYRRHDCYCLPSCGNLPTMTLRRLMLFGSRERAEAEGLKPCATCRPDVHPLTR